MTPLGALAAAPAAARSIMRAKPAVVNGEPQIKVP
jgi:hypothetical protein